ncbi:MAG: STAS domain-containing protein [Candidatus Baltobacteraceae bacterium]
MVISLAGEWDIYQAPQLRERLQPAYAQAEVVLDLTSAKYVTSSLITALVLAHKHRVASGMVPASLAVRSAFVRRLLTLTGLDELFPIYDDVEEALEAGNTVG